MRKVQVDGAGQASPIISYYLALTPHNPAVDLEILIGGDDVGKRNPKQSSAKTASAASATLKSKATGKLTKQLAGSVLAQAKPSKRK